MNKPGASGSIGRAYAAATPVDGYRLVLMTPEMMVVPLIGIGKTPDEFYFATLPAIKRAAWSNSFRRERQRRVRC